MRIRARFQPHRRGFGFLEPVEADGLTATTVELPAGDGTVEVGSAFVPPPAARGLIAGDLVEAEVTADDRGATASEVAVVARPRRMLVGRVGFGTGSLVLEPDPTLGSGWIPLAPELAQRLMGAVGRQIVVLSSGAEPGETVARALVAGPHVVGSPQAIRASATVLALGRAAPSLVPGGAPAAGLDPVEAETTHVRVVGLLAGGGRGGAAGLDTAGPVPAHDMMLVDRRDEPAVTVDDAATRDVDDAIAAFWDGSDRAPVSVAVHIADVAAFVGVGSAADRYARTVAATAYPAVGQSAPMIDPALSEGALSLLPGEERQVLSVRFDVGADGSLSDVSVEAALVTSRAKLSYRALDAWLGGDSEALAPEAGHDVRIAEAVLAGAFEASRRLGVQRDARGTFEDLFTQAEVTPALIDGKLATVDAEPHAEAYRLIERLMVAANEAVAGWLVRHGIPALYRAHQGFEPGRLERLRRAAELAGAEVPALDDETPDTDRVVTEVLAEADRLGTAGRTADRDLLVGAAAGATARATYDPDPSHHRGLGADAYVHFTSPIRRYADLVIHRQVRAALGGEPPPHGAADLAGLGTWLDARSGAIAAMAAWERTDLWARILDRGFLHRPEPAVVTDLTRNGLRVRLPRLGLGAFVTAENALGLPGRQRASLEVDEHGLTTTSGPWRVGTRVHVRYRGLDGTGRPNFELVSGR